MVTALPQRHPLVAQRLAPLILAIPSGFVIGMLACSHDIGLTTADDTTSAGDGGTVERASLSVSVTVSGSDSVLARALGSAPGVLEAAEVVTRRLGTAEPPRSSMTDASGRVLFSELLPGTYQTSALRLLASEEIAQLGPENADVNALGGGRNLVVAAPRTDATVPVIAARRGSSVTSEHFGPVPRTSSGEPYPYGGFFEVYNNSDTTIYLDGKVLAIGSRFLFRDIPDCPCSASAVWRQDPEGIWSRFIEQFPGSGQNHPLTPGAATVIAIDAIDHRQFFPELYDLSRAQFEFIGPSDVDNPNAANMITLGFPHSDAFGHGMMVLSTGDDVIILADRINLAALPKAVDPCGKGFEHWRIPRAKILDVLTKSPVPEKEASRPFPACNAYVHPDFDSQAAPLQDPGAIESHIRRTLVIDVGGTTLLQRTKTSALDWARRSIASPGQIP